MLRTSFMDCSWYLQIPMTTHPKLHFDHRIPRCRTSSATCNCRSSAGEPGEPWNQRVPHLMRVGIVTSHGGSGNLGFTGLFTSSFLFDKIYENGKETKLKAMSNIVFSRAILIRTYCRLYTYARSMYQQLCSWSSFSQSNDRSNISSYCGYPILILNRENCIIASLRGLVFASTVLLLTLTSSFEPRKHSFANLSHCFGIYVHRHCTYYICLHVVLIVHALCWYYH